VKKIYLLSLLAAFSLNLLCQQDNLIVHDSTYIYKWDTITNDWVVYSRSVSTYDAIGNQTEGISYNWDSETNDWMGNRRYVTLYDANGNLTEYISYTWDSKTSNWVGEWRDVTQYDANGNRTEQIGYDWDSETNEWINTWKHLSYWSELTTSISNNTHELNYLIYPIPFSDYTTLKLSDANQVQRIDLIDIYGRIVRTIDNVNSNSVTIHRENLPSGIYFIRIHADEPYVKKVIIR